MATTPASVAALPDTVTDDTVAHPEHQSAVHTYLKQIAGDITAEAADKIASDDITDIVKLTQASYDALAAPSATTLYVILDAAGGAATAIINPSVNTDEPATLQPLTATGGTYENGTVVGSGWYYEEPAAEVVTPSTILGDPYEGIPLTAQPGDYQYDVRIVRTGWYLED